MPVVDPMLVTSAQPRQPFHHPLPVPHFHMLHEQTHLDPLADQTARHRIGVAVYVNQAAAVHPHPRTLARFQPPLRQSPQHPQFLRQPRLTPRIQLRQQLPQKTRIGLPAPKVSTSPQHQVLIDRFLEAPMQLFHVTVFVRLSRLNLLCRQTIVRQQPLVPPREFLHLRPVVHRQAHAVRAMPLWHPTQFAQGVLQSFAQALEAL
jgi:hypothetical protein